MGSAKNNQTFIKQQPLFFKAQLILVVAVVAACGAYFVSRIYAASGSISVLPATTSVNIGDTVKLTIHENSGTDTVNAVEANLTYDSTKLQYVSTDDTGSAFGVAAATTVATGSLQLARGVSGGSAPVSGDQLVTTVSFKALAAGSTPVTVATGSALVRSTDNADILAIKNGSTLTLADTGAPTVPQALSAPTVNLTSVSLAWAASTDNVGVAAYRIYRNGTQVASSTTTSYTDSGLTPNTKYTYTVAAADVAGNLSAQSTAVIPTTLADTSAPTVPGKPTSSTQSMTSISLSWTVSTDNVGVTGYRVYRNGTQVATPTTASYTDTGLAVNTSYSYTVAAVDAAGNVSAQTTATAVKTLPDTQAPTQPVGLTGTVSVQNIVLNWSASTDNVAVTGYNIYRDGTQIATSATAGYTVANAQTGTHVYTVAAVDGSGNISTPSAGVSLQVYLASDINHDTKVNVFDLSTLLSNWAKTGTNASDINHDNLVNIFDLSILLSNWTG